MSNPDLISLINRAGEKVGSEYKLAKVMGVPQQHISNWKAGTRTCTPEDRARLAGFAQEDAVQELVRATLEKTAGTLKGDQLFKLLGKSLRQTGAAMHTVVLAVVSAVCLMLIPTPSHSATLDNVYYVNLND